MSRRALAAFVGLASVLVSQALAETPAVVPDDVIEEQNAALMAATEGVGFGPQSPRDLGSSEGTNPRIFGFAPTYRQMNLCNIHLHEGAEHRGGNFTTYAGNGNGEGFGTGYLYDGELSPTEMAPVDFEVGESEEGTLEPGDTIEVHFVFTTAAVAPGETLAACLDDETTNPQLRVEAQVFVLVNDEAAADFVEISRVETIGGYAQAPELPDKSGTPVVYAGSTTGPKYNEVGSPFEVTWSVRPEVIKLDIASLAEWLEGNVFAEAHAHGARNLVTTPELLSTITK